MPRRRIVLLLLAVAAVAALVLAAIRLSPRAPDRRAPEPADEPAGSRRAAEERQADAILSSLVSDDVEGSALRIERELSESSDRAGLHFALAVILTEHCPLFDPRRAGRHLEEALRIDPGFPTARARRIALGRMLRQNSDPPPDAGAERRPEASAEEVALQGLAWIARGRPDEAMRAADEIIRRGGDVFAYGLAPAFILTGQHRTLAAMYDPELERSGTRAAGEITHLHAGLNDLLSDRDQEALWHFERGLEFVGLPWQSGRRALFHRLRARALGRLGRRAEEAQALAEAARQAGPSAPAPEGGPDCVLGDVIDLIPG